MACGTLKRPLESDPLFSPNRHPVKRRRLAARMLFDCPSASNAPRDDIPSAFTSAASRLSPEQMQTRLRHEIRQIKRLKQFGLLAKESPTSLQCGLSASSSASSSPSSLGAIVDNFGESMKSGVGVSKDAPLFTFRQVGLICERMLQEREDTLRREYEHVLGTKLAEQYDTFVKFTHDQIQKRFEAASAPSYLS